MAILKENEKDGNKQRSRISMTTPWDGGISNVAAVSRHTRGDIGPQGAESMGDIDLNNFVKERSVVHTEYIRQAEITKRWAMIVGSVCILLSAIVLVFAPEGREIISYLIGIVLLIVAAGAFGYSRIKIRKDDLEVGASNQ